MMGSSSPYLQLVSCGDNNINIGGFLSFKDHHHSPFNHSHRYKFLDFKLSISSPPPLSISSQAKVYNHELLIQESPNGYAIEPETQTVGVQFKLQRECSFGQKFLITGDHPILGLWDPNNAVSLTWSDGHIWSVHLDIPVGKCIKFKFIMQESNSKFVWQPGPDRLLECFQTKKIITLCEDWENPDSRRIIETDHPTMNQSVGTDEAGYMKEVLVSDEGVPILVPGLSQLTVNEGPNNEPGPVNEASMVAKDLSLPELNQFQLSSEAANISNLNPRTEISSTQENHESCENKHQVAEEQDHEAITSFLHNDIQWSNSVMQKFLNIFGIHQ